MLDVFVFWAQICQSRKTLTVVDLFKISYKFSYLPIEEFRTPNEYGGTRMKRCWQRLSLCKPKIRRSFSPKVHQKTKKIEMASCVERKISNFPENSFAKYWVCQKIAQNLVHKKIGLQPDKQRKRRAWKPGSKHCKEPKRWTNFHGQTSMDKLPWTNCPKKQIKQIERTWKQLSSKMSEVSNFWIQLPEAAKKSWIFLPKYTGMTKSKICMSGYPLSIRLPSSNSLVAELLL